MGTSTAAPSGLPPVWKCFTKKFLLPKSYQERWPFTSALKAASGNSFCAAVNRFDKYMLNIRNVEGYWLASGLLPQAIASWVLLPSKSQWITKPYRERKKGGRCGFVTNCKFTRLITKRKWKQPDLHLQKNPMWLKILAPYTSQHL